MNVQTKIDPPSVSIYHLDHKIAELRGLESDDDYEIENADFTVFWNVELEVRDWGVKDISLFVTDIKGSFDVVRFDDNGDSDGEPEHIIFDFAEFKKEALLEITLDGNQLLVSGLDIDFKEKSIAVY